MTEKIKKNFWVDLEMVSRWEAFADARGWTLTMLIKEAVHKFIKDETIEGAPAILKQIAEVSTKKNELIAERDAVNAEIKARVERIEEMMSKMASTTTATEDDKARVLGLISKAGFSLKELVGALTMPIERVSAVLNELREFKLAYQVEENKKLVWKASKGVE